MTQALTLPDTSPLERDASMLVAAARAFAIHDDETYVEAGERRRECKRLQDQIEAAVGPVRDAAHKAHKSACDLIKRLSAPAAEADVLYERKRLAWADQQRREREAEQRRLQEIARKAEEERRLAEALAREEEARRQAAAAEAARKAGDAERAAELAAAAAEEQQAAEAIVSEPVYVAPPVLAPAVPKQAGTYERETWTFIVDDESRVPREYLRVDLVKIGNTVRMQRGETRIPGVRVFAQRSEAVRR
jgi:hypothetical protein